MQTRSIGQSGLVSSVIGLGCMAMSEFYGSSDHTENLKTLNRALELGVTMLDTADLYGDGDNERLLQQLLVTVSNKPLIATKCGIVRGKEILSDSNFRREINGAPEYITASCDNSLKRLGVDVIDLYYLHRVDPKIPIEESVGALSDLVTAGKVRAIGLSEANADDITRGHATHPLAAVQSEYSLWSRTVESEVLPVLRKLGISLICYSPLGRGLIRSEGGDMAALETDDFRNTLPRFKQENIERNAPLFDMLDAASKAHDASVSQIYLGWLLAQGQDIIPIPGSRKLTHLEQNIAAAGLVISDEWLSRLTSMFDTNAVSGDRYTVGKSVHKN
jgi:aryl-alcohol dehydrogenase-like predicted oxidoreductase